MNPAPATQGTVHDGPVICAPMRAEARWLRHGCGATPAADVLRTGMGLSRANHVGRSPRLQQASAVAVSGIAGALQAGLRAGDVVVASEVREVRRPERVVRCRSAPFLAASLRARGLRVRVGPVVSSGHLASGSAREELARSGALAVDMESAGLVGHVSAPVAVVRVIADTAGEPLLRPGTLGRVRVALGRLPEIATVLQAWASAVGDRTVLLAGPRSFCAGVERAIEVVELALRQRGAPVYVRKQIVHNVHVVRGLEQRGAVFVDDLDDVPVGSTVVFSAHGVSPAVREEASRRGLRVVDATCPLVSKVHTEVRRFSDRGDTVLFIGHAGHEETVGTMGERPESTVLVECVEHARSIEVPDPARVSYLVQTTLAADEVDTIVEVLQGRFPGLRAAASDDICYATTNRQSALRGVAEGSDVVLVVGSRNSSNSRRLVEAAERMGASAYLVDDAHEVPLEWLTAAHTVGLTAGASAPTTLVDEVVDALRGLGMVEVQERRVTREHVHFTLPKEVRYA